MQYIVEENLSNFKFWSGGKDRANMLTTEQLDKIGDELEQLYNAQGVELTDTQINDLFWFEFPYVCGMIGLKLDENENVIEDMEDWSGEIIRKAYPNIADIYFDDFWFDQTCPHNEPDWSSKQEVLESFAEYIDDNYWVHAQEVLEKEIPYISADARNDYAYELWQKYNSDELNVKAFFVWWDQVQEQYKEG